MPASAYIICPAFVPSISWAGVCGGVFSNTGRNAVSMIRPQGSLVPGLRTMMPPAGVLVFASKPNCFRARLFSTAPCIDTWSIRTGLSGKALSRSSRLRSRPSGMTVSS